MLKKFLEYSSNPLKVEVEIEDRETNKRDSFVETIHEYDYDEVMSRKFGFLSKLHKLLSDKYDTKETRYVGFEWIDKYNESLDSQIIKTTDTLLKDSVPVTNNTEILKYVVDIQMDSYKNGKKSLSANLITELTNVFGSANKKMRLEYLTNVWFLEFKGINYNVFSSSRKGTGIEVCGLSYDEVRNVVNKEEIKEFLDELYKVLNK